MPCAHVHVAMLYATLPCRHQEVGATSCRKRQGQHKSRTEEGVPDLLGYNAPRPMTRTFVITGIPRLRLSPSAGVQRSTFAAIIIVWGGRWSFPPASITAGWPWLGLPCSRGCLSLVVLRHYTRIDHFNGIPDLGVLRVETGWEQLQVRLKDV